MTRFKTFDEVAEKLGAASGINHEIVWWVERPLTMDEWIELDNLQSEVFDKMNIPVSGYAGPIPFEETEDAEEGA